jgi:hypothetical protein
MIQIVDNRRGRRKTGTRLIPGGPSALEPEIGGASFSRDRNPSKEDSVDNLEKVKNAGVDMAQMSPEEKQVIQSLSPEEMDTMLKAKGKYDNLTKGKPISTSLKVL